jgi:hypothetical protein
MRASIMVEGTMMKNKPYSWDVFRVVSTKRDGEFSCLEDLYNMPVSGSDTPEQNLLMMISKLVHMTESLCDYMETKDASTFGSCQALIQEIHRHERLATAGVIDQGSLMGKSVFKIVIRFPSRMERIAHARQHLGVLSY